MMQVWKKNFHYFTAEKQTFITPQTRASHSIYDGTWTGVTFLELNLFVEEDIVAWGLEFRKSNTIHHI